MSAKRTIRGDWMGTMFWLGGERTDWTLSIRMDGTFQRTVAPHSAETISERGTWSFDEETDVLSFVPDGDEETHQWRVLDITKCERSNSMLVLRKLMLGSRNLPILLYRVHHKPHGECP